MTVSTSTTPPPPVFVNDQQTTTYTERRIQMQLDPSDRMTLGHLQDFVSFALASGASLDEPVNVGPMWAAVVRQGTAAAVTSSPA